MRYLFGSIGDWDALFQEAFKVCKPGGWLESIEATIQLYSDDGTVLDTSAMHEWGKIHAEGGKKIGRSFTVVEDNLQELSMTKAGFVDLQIKYVKVPIGGWSADKKLKEVGLYSQVALMGDLEGYVTFMAT